MQPQRRKLARARFYNNLSRAVINLYRDESAKKWETPLERYHPDLRGLLTEKKRFGRKDYEKLEEIRDFREALQRAYQDGTLYNDIVRGKNQEIREYYRSFLQQTKDRFIQTISSEPSRNDGADQSSDQSSRNDGEDQSSDQSSRNDGTDQSSDQSSINGADFNLNEKSQRNQQLPPDPIGIFDQESDQRSIAQNSYEITYPGEQSIQN